MGDRLTTQIGAPRDRIIFRGATLETVGGVRENAPYDPNERVPTSFYFRGDPLAPPECDDFDQLDTRITPAQNPLGASLDPQRTHDQTPPASVEGIDSHTANGVDYFAPSQDSPHSVSLTPTVKNQERGIRASYSFSFE